MLNALQMESVTAQRNKELTKKKPPCMVCNVQNWLCVMCILGILFFPYFVSDVDEVEVLDNVYRKRMITDDKHQSSTVGSGKIYI